MFGYYEVRQSSRHVASVLVDILNCPKHYDKNSNRPKFSALLLEEHKQRSDPVPVSLDETTSPPVLQA